jgi:uncharacterized membrane protein YkoI
MRLTQLVVLLICCASALAVAAADDSRTVALSETPAAVQKTINGRIGDGKLGNINASVSGGETVYDVGLTSKDGQERDFTVAGDGTLLSVEVTLDETPVAVQKTIRAQGDGWGLESVDKNLDDVEASYDVEVSKDGRNKTFTVGEDGALLSMEMTLGEAPAAVQRTVQTQVGEGKLKSIDEIFDEDGTNYDADITEKDGHDKGFTVAPDGRLLSEQVTWDAVTPAARKTIKEQIGDGTILRIDKALLEKQQGVLPYEVQGRKNGKPFDFSVGPRGKFLGMQD